MNAVMGGDAVHALGYGYFFDPVLLNIAVMLLVAVAFNYPFVWRRYPQAWMRKPAAPAAEPAEKMIPHSDLVYALSQIDTFVDVSEEDLQRIYALALGHHHPAQGAATLVPGAAPVSGSAG